MKKLLFALFYISSIQCYSQIELSEITVYKDTIISSKVKIVDFGKYKGFVFPKEYGLVRFSHPKEKRECFDIDTILVRKIEEELTRQYYSAQKYFMEQRYNEIYEYERKYPGSYILKDLKMFLPVGVNLPQHSSVLCRLNSSSDFRQSAVRTVCRVHLRILMFRLHS